MIKASGMKRKSRERRKSAYRVHLSAKGWIESGNAFAADIGSVIDALLIESARVRLAQVHLYKFN